ncbi:MAG: hypothetical protein H5U40_07440 [Polyangiaceae bacterium]|nr:hypothetical protein [Polyangiaceae bacterium]
MPFIAGLFGIVHDQLTYSIAPEYYTRFKFEQFRIAPALAPRVGAAIVGFLATWWVGLLLGPILVAAGGSHRTASALIRSTLTATVVVCGVALAVGVGGLAYGVLVLADSPEALSGWFLPPGLEDARSFIAVGAMHNGTYLGSLVGLGVGVVVQRRGSRARG